MADHGISALASLPLPTAENGPDAAELQCTPVLVIQNSFAIS
jgi:hypothetical protein